MESFWPFFVCGFVAALINTCHYQFLIIPRVRRKTREITRQEMIGELKWTDAYSDTALKSRRKDLAWKIQNRKESNDVKYRSEIPALMEEMSVIDKELKRRSDETRRKRDPLKEFDAVYDQLLKNTDKKELE